MEKQLEQLLQAQDQGKNAKPAPVAEVAPIAAAPSIASEPETVEVDEQPEMKAIQPRRKRRKKVTDDGAIQDDK